MKLRTYWAGILVVIVLVSCIPGAKGDGTSASEGSSEATSEDNEKKQ